MHSTTLQRLAAAGVAAMACLAVGAAPAQADSYDGTASLGSVDVLDGMQQYTSGSLASCDIGGTTSAYSPGAYTPGIARFGSGNTTCTRDDAQGTSHVEAWGNRFQLDALTTYGGPRIRLEQYRATCDATTHGTQENVWMSGLSGVSVPSQIPANYRITIPGRYAGDPPLAWVTFNEVQAPSPNDGSISVNLMHVVLFPEGGPKRGDVLVGSAACAPVF